MPIWASKKYRQERSKRVAKILRNKVKKEKVTHIETQKALNLVDKVATGIISKP